MPGPLTLESARARWKEVGQTVNTSYFAVRDGVLLALPEQGCRDTEATALENNVYQREYFEQRGTAGVVVIAFDRIAEQERGARTVYSEKTSPEWACGIALIGGTMLTRALGSFFMGLSQPAVPIRMFADIEAADGWINERLGGNRG